MLIDIIVSLALIAAGYFARPFIERLRDLYQNPHSPLFKIYYHLRYGYDELDQRIAELEFDQKIRDKEKAPVEVIAEPSLMEVAEACHGRHKKAKEEAKRALEARHGKPTS